MVRPRLVILTEWVRPLARKDRTPESEGARSPLRKAAATMARNGAGGGGDSY